MKSPRYGTLIAWAEELGLEDAVALLQETLEEEKTTDETLTKRCQSAGRGRLTLQMPRPLAGHSPDPVVEAGEQIPSSRAVD